MTQCACNREPTLGEMLEDPIVQLLMARDGVGRPEVERLIGGVASAPAAAGRRIGGCDCASAQRQPQGAHG